MMIVFCQKCFKDFKYDEVKISQNVNQSVCTECEVKLNGGQNEFKTHNV